MITCLMSNLVLGGNNQVGETVKDWAGLIYIQKKKKKKKKKT